MRQQHASNGQEGQQALGRIAGSMDSGVREDLLHSALPWGGHIWSTSLSIPQTHTNEKQNNSVDVWGMAHRTQSGHKAVDGIL